MASKVDYAVLSAVAYNNIRGADNVLAPLPSGWALADFAHSALNRLDALKGACLANTGCNSSCRARVTRTLHGAKTCHHSCSICMADIVTGKQIGRASCRERV